MGYKKILFWLMCYFTFTSNVSAAMCDDNHIKQLNELADQIDVNYEYVDHDDDINTNGDGEYSLNVYTVSVNLISNELFVMQDNYSYYFNQDNNGLVKFFVNSGDVNLTIHSSKCNNKKLRTISLKLPRFNSYSYRAECKKLSNYNLDVCNPWYQGTFNDSYFYNIVNKYLNKPEEKENFLDIIIKFYEKYQLIIVVTILLIVLGIIAFFKYRKRSVLE